MYDKLTFENDSPSVGVYLGANVGNNPEFERSAHLLGEGLASLGLTLVYGGGGVGLMGVLSRAVKQSGGRVIGIITEHLASIESPPNWLDELYIVDSMYERKRLIHEKSSQFIVMPGGMGTFDELFETWCAIKIGTLKKSMGFINVAGYFDPLLQFITSSKPNGFLGETDLDIPSFYKDVPTCLTALENDTSLSRQEVVA